MSVRRRWALAASGASESWRSRAPSGARGDAGRGTRAVRRASRTGPSTWSRRSRGAGSGSGGPMSKRSIREPGLDEAPAGHDVIVVGASLGGIYALQTLMAGLPPDLQAAAAVVQQWRRARPARSGRSSTGPARSPHVSRKTARPSAWDRSWWPHPTGTCSSPTGWFASGAALARTGRARPSTRSSGRPPSPIAHAWSAWPSRGSKTTGRPGSRPSSSARDRRGPGLGRRRLRRDAPGLARRR